MGIQLVDCHRRALDFPTTFAVPLISEINALVLGDQVKLIVTDEDGYRGERLWFTIKGHTGTGFIGILDNVPICHAMAVGTALIFEAQHICAIWKQDQGRYPLSERR